MSNCGKGILPECQYFTTGGCISPFNCLFRTETPYRTTATSLPVGMTDDEIERCLGMSTIGEANDIMNFDYASTLAYIKRLKSENAALRERIDNAVKRLKDREQSVYFGLGEWKAVVTDKDIDEVFGVTESSLEEPEGE